MNVRNVVWGDFQDLVDNYYSIYDELPSNPTVGILLFAQRPALAEEVNWFTGFYRNLLAGDTVACVAEVDGHAVGLVTVGRGPHADGAHVGELGILIRREHRGKGVGKALMKAALERSRGKFEMVQLRVFATNEIAKRLYRSLGFRTVGTIPRAIKRGESYIDEEIMVLSHVP